MSTTYQVHASTLVSADFKKIQYSLLQWLNSGETLDFQVKDIFKDLFIAKVLAVMIEQEMDVNLIDMTAFPGCSQRDFGLIMGIVIPYVEKNLVSNPERWTLKGILAYDYSSLLSFLVDLAVVFESPYPLPPNFTLIVTMTQVVNGSQVKKNLKYVITEAAVADEQTQSNASLSNELLEKVKIAEDVFERLIDTPSKLAEVSQLLLAFVNSNIGELNLKLDDIYDLYDSGYLILLIGMAEKTAEKEKNIDVALQLLSDIKLDTSKLKKKDIMDRDLKAISRSVFLLQQISESL